MKKKPLLSKKAIINETVRYYSANPNERRAVNDGGYCEYHTGKGQMCAVGRCLTNPKATERFLKKKMNTSEVTGTGITELRDLYRNNHKAIPFQEKYKGHEVDFWSDLQNFHDRTENWDEDTGLTSYGKDSLRKLHNDWDKE